MTLEIRPTDEPEHFGLYDGDNRIGVLHRGELTEDDVAEGEAPYWEFTVWSAMGTGKEWRGDADTLDEARERVREAHQEFLAERRELSQGRHPNAISVPMGGQKRRR